MSYKSRSGWVMGLCFEDCECRLCRERKRAVKEEVTAKPNKRRTDVTIKSSAS